MASCVTVQVGQCGNQVGGALFDVLAQETSRARRRNAFFCAGTAADDAPPTARAVLVDSEPKVVSACVEAAARSPHRWRYDAARAACVAECGRGSANNWAYGYHIHGRSGLRDRVRESVRRQVEACDWFDGFLVVQSAAGGTGSGLGSALTAALRDDYGLATIANVLVWPYQCGEVIVQHYNAVLTLANVLPYSDSVVMFENTRVHGICSTNLRMARPTFRQLNGVIARDLASGVLLPCPSSGAAPCGGPSAAWAAAGFGGGLSGVLGGLCAHPAYKLVGIHSTPQEPDTSRAFSSHSWPALLKQLRQDCTRNAVATLHGRLVLRGLGAADVVQSCCGDPVIDPDASTAGGSGAAGLATAGRPRPRGGSAERTRPAFTAYQQGQQDAALRDSIKALGQLSPAWRRHGNANDCPPAAAAAAEGTPWTTSSSSFRLHGCSAAFDGHERHATLVSVDSGVVAPLRAALQRCYAMLHAGAYLHEYAQHGAEKADVVEATACLEQVLQDYESIHHA